MLLLMLGAMNLNSQRIISDPNSAIQNFLSDPWGPVTGSMGITLIPALGPAKHKTFDNGLIIEKPTIQLGKKKGTYNVISSHSNFPPKDGNLGVSIGSFSKTQSFGTLWDGKRMITLPKASNVTVTYNGGNSYTFLMEFEGNRLSITISSYEPG